MIVFAFDRDLTLDVSPHPHRETVPLSWVRYLAEETPHEVWATGNQRLKSEAGIPGLQECVRRRDGEWYDHLGERVDDEYFERWPTRRQRVGMLADLFPDAEAYVVVDDHDLSDLEGWHHFYAWELVTLARAGDLSACGIEVPLPPPGDR